MTAAGAREKGCVDCYSRVISGGYLGHSTLDSRFRGNDGGEGKGEWMRWLQFKPDSQWLSCLGFLDSRLRGNDGVESGNGGAQIGDLGAIAVQTILAPTLPYCAAA